MLVAFAITFVVLLVIGVPVAFVLGMSGLASLLVWQEVSPSSIIPQRVFSGMNSFPLMAIPFFILAGELMSTSIMAKLMQLANAAIGHLKGGLAHVNIVASMFFGGITGAGVADTAAIGSILIPAMEKEGYAKDFSAAVTAASSTLGPIIPPSIPMVLYALTVGNISIGALFIAGVVPGFLIGLGLLDEIVRRLTERDKSPPSPLPEIARRAAPRAPRFLKRALRRFVKPIVDSKIREDRSRRACFAVPANSANGCVRVNLVGREAHGKVRPGAEYEALVDQLISDLKEIENVDSGEKIVSGIWRSREIFTGPRVEELPDIIMEWRGNNPVTRVRSSKIGEIHRGVDGWLKWGDHTPHGFMMFRAPGVRVGEVEEPASVLDIAPTISARCSVKLENVEGEVWPL